MKISIEKDILETIIMNTNPYVEKKDLSSINSHVLMSVKNNVLTVKATDGEIGLSYKIERLSVNEEGEATANGKKLLDIIKSLKPGQIILETIEKYIYIKQNNSKYKLPMHNVSDFPQFPDINDKSKFEIDAGILGRSLKKILPCIEQTNPKIEITGALIDIQKENINLVSTDGRRLSLYNIKTNSQEELKLIIPKKAISEIQKLFNGEIEIYYDLNVFIATSKSFEFYTKLINGKYPSYEKIIEDKQFENKITLDRENFIEGIKTISMLSETLKITFNSENIVFENHNDDNSEAKTNLEFKTNIEESFSLIVRSKALLDFLFNIEESSFSFGYNDSKSRFILESGDLKTVIVPITA